MSHRKKEKTERKNKKITAEKVPRCGLCGKTKKLTKTDCCGQWICDDADQYVLFSYERNSCWRNHDHYTLCSNHYQNKHDGDWKDCSKCKDDIDKTELYVWYGTNEYNYEKLEDPPEYEPTKCYKCGIIIFLTEESYHMKGGKYYCQQCDAN